MSVGGENKNLESCSAVGIVSGTSARNALLSTEYTVSCNIGAVLHRDCNRIVGRFCTDQDQCIIWSSSGVTVTGISCGTEPFGSAA